MIPPPLCLYTALFDISGVYRTATSARACCGRCRASRRAPFSCPKMHARRISTAVSRNPCGFQWMSGSAHWRSRDVYDYRARRAWCSQDLSSW